MPRFVNQATVTASINYSDKFQVTCFVKVLVKTTSCQLLYFIFGI